MKLYSFCTSNFWPLRDRFERSVPDDVEVEIVNIDHLFIEENALSGGRAVSQWKPQFVVDTIARHWGELIVIADIDIQFFRSFKADVEVLISGKHMLFQDRFRSGNLVGDVNIGFMVIYCDDFTHLFWEQVCQEVNYHIDDPPAKHRIYNQWWDEGVVNKLLEKGVSMRWTTLPDRYYLVNKRSGRNRHVIPEDIVLHHAIRTGPDTIESKLAQMDFVRDNVGMRVRRCKQVPGLALWKDK